MSGVFRGFLFSYVLIFVIPLFLSFYIYNENIKALEDNVQEASLAALETSMVALDGRLGEMENYATLFSMDQQAISFAKRKSPYVDGSLPTLINDIRKKLVPASIANQFISDMFLYYRESDVIISPNASYLSWDRFYGDFFRYGSYTGEEFRELLQANQYRNAYFACDSLLSRQTYSQTSSEPGGSGFLFLNTFPSSQSAKGQIVMIVSADTLRSTLSGVTEEWNSDVYIFDNRGGLFFTTEVPRREELLSDSSAFATGDTFSRAQIGGESFILVRTVSEFNGWNYVMKIPQAVVGERLTHVRSLLYLYVALTVLIGLALALFFTFRNTKPISGVVSLLDSQGDGEKRSAGRGNEYSYIANSIRDLYQNNEHLKGSLDRQKPLMRTTFVEKLLSGWFDDREEILWFASQLDFRSLEGSLLVLIAHFDFSGRSRDDALMDTINMVKSACEKALSTRLGTDVYYYDMDFDHRAMILGLREDLMGEYQSLLSDEVEKLSGDIFAEFGIQVQFAAGSLVADYMEVSHSYTTALESLPYLSMSADRLLVWPDALPEGVQSYYYPLSLETQLMNAVRGSDPEEIHKLMSLLLRENFSDQILLPEMKDLLFSEIRGTAIKLLESLPADPEQGNHNLRQSILELEFEAPAEELIIQLEGIFVCIGEAYQRGRSQKNNRLVEMVKEYTGEHFSDQQLNLNDMANRFSITASYLSQLFKEATGQNFSRYLESLRLEQARKLLGEHLPVKEVAEQVGYSSVYVFRTAFKRNYGISPSEYRADIK